MRTTKRLIQTSAMVAGVLGAVAIAAPDSRAGRAVRSLVARLTGDVRYAIGAGPGIVYRLSGGKPDPDVADDVLADRVRSSIGGLEKRLDVPHVHVMVDAHVVLLHGEVGNQADAEQIERAVLAVSGVEGVVSHLHIGLLDENERPSHGGDHAQPSPAMRALLDAAVESGASQPRLAVHSVLCRFLDRLPGGEREHVYGHLPSDVRALLGPARSAGEADHIRKYSELVAEVQRDDVIAPSFVDGLVRRVVHALHGIVSDEVDDVAAVLPADLRQLWEPASASATLPSRM